jgi:hypothetical protein
MSDSIQALAGRLSSGRACCSQSRGPIETTSSHFASFAEQYGENGRGAGDMELLLFSSYLYIRSFRLRRLDTGCALQGAIRGNDDAGEH